MHFQGILAGCCPLTAALLFHVGHFAVLSGVLKFKHESELALMSSGLPYTILRPSRLTDGPYTSYDLNTLLQVSPSVGDHEQFDCWSCWIARIALPVCLPG